MNQIHWKKFVESDKILPIRVVDVIYKKKKKKLFSLDKTYLVECTCGLCGGCISYNYSRLKFDDKMFVCIYIYI